MRTTAEYIAEVEDLMLDVDLCSAAEQKQLIKQATIWMGLAQCAATVESVKAQKRLLEEYA